MTDGETDGQLSCRRYFWQTDRQTGGRAVAVELVEVPLAGADRALLFA